MRALVLCFGTVAAIAGLSLLCSCAHGGTDSTESASESELLLFWPTMYSVGTPSCPFTRLGPVDVLATGTSRRGQVSRQLQAAARAQGGDAVIRITRVPGRQRDGWRGEVIKFTDPDCRY
jgi:hypothetical protein